MLTSDNLNRFKRSCAHLSNDSDGSDIDEIVCNKHRKQVPFNNNNNCNTDNSDVNDDNNNNSNDYGNNEMSSSPSSISSLSLSDKMDITTDVETSFKSIDADSSQLSSMTTAILASTADDKGLYHNHYVPILNPAFAPRKQQYSRKIDHMVDDIIRKCSRKSFFDSAGGPCNTSIISIPHSIDYINAAINRGLTLRTIDDDDDDECDNSVQNDNSASINNSNDADDDAMSSGSNCQNNELPTHSGCITHADWGIEEVE